MLIEHQNRSDSGFTLIEVLVVTAIIAALVAIGTPSFLNWKKGADLNANTRGLYSFFQKTRMEAVKRNEKCNIVSKVDADGNIIGSLSFMDTVGANDAYDVGEEVITDYLFTGGIRGTAAFSRSFNNRGLINAATTITLTTNNAITHDLIISTRGRMRIQ